MIQIPEYTKTYPEGVYEKTFTVTEEITGGKATLSAGDFSRLMQGITEDHLETYGMTHQSLMDESRIWVISWTLLKIRRLPAVGEQVLLRIWPGKNKAGMHTRKYALYTAAGEPLAGAGSFFSLMDAAERKIALPTKEMQAIPVVKCENEPDLPRLMIPFPQELPDSIQRIVAADEIDNNGHLNNSFYIDWAVELAAAVYNMRQSPESVWVRFSRELLEGETVILKSICAGDAVYIQGCVGSAESFSVQITY